MMVFKKISRMDPATGYVAKRIADLLSSDKKVLWLLQGGSSVALEVAVARRLDSHPHAAKLTIGLADERYGRPGHPDSNWRHLLKAGFQPDKFSHFSLLNGQDLQATVKAFRQKLSDLLANNDFVLVMAGIGTDGHTIGIKPGSPAVDSTELAEGYQWDDYTRITVTGSLLRRADEVVSFAMGAEKKPVLEMLRQDASPSEHPAQLLKLAPRVIIFNESLEGNV